MIEHITKSERNTFVHFLLLPNVYKTEVYHNWDMIIADKDDNKFVDCAVAVNVGSIVTHDNHYNVLKNFDFFKIAMIDQLS